MANETLKPKKISLVLTDDGEGVSFRLHGDTDRIGHMPVEDLELIETLAIQFFAACTAIMQAQGGFKSCADPHCPNCSEKPMVN